MWSPGEIIGRAGSLRFFGDWFGRPYDNRHVIQSVESESQRLTLTFTNGDRLTIWYPTDVLLGSSKMNRLPTGEAVLAIAGADRVRFEWYEYGLPRTAENLRYLDYERSGRDVIRRTNFSHHSTAFAPSLDCAAVELL